MKYVFTIFFAAVAWGCGDSDDSNAAAGTAGYTDCGSISCQPGTFCSAADQCSPGCTSDINCDGDKTCGFSEGATVGRCGSKSKNSQPTSGSSSSGSSDPSNGS